MLTERSITDEEIRQAEEIYEARQLLFSNPRAFTEKYQGQTLDSLWEAGILPADFFLGTPPEGWIIHEVGVWQWPDRMNGIVVPLFSDYILDEIFRFCGLPEETAGSKQYRGMIKDYLLELESLHKKPELAPLWQKYTLTEVPILLAEAAVREDYPYHWECGIFETPDLEKETAQLLQERRILFQAGHPLLANMKLLAIFAKIPPEEQKRQLPDWATLTNQLTAK